MAAKSTPRKSKISWLLATFFGVGFLRPGPGTYASAATVLCWWAASRLVPASFVSGYWVLPAQIAAAVAVTLIGIHPATVVEREYGKPDPGFVVIDEVAGQMIALIAAPVHWKYLLAGFILFRGFDITKPFPVRRLERLPGGIGIMMDDVGAGVYALILLQLWLHLKIW
jgi:phosphatidylglycerophosphatase A